MKPLHPPPISAQTSPKPLHQMASTCNGDTGGTAGCGVELPVISAAQEATFSVFSCRSAKLTRDSADSSLRQPWKGPCYSFCAGLRFHLVPYAVQNTHRRKLWTRFWILWHGRVWVKKDKQTSCWSWKTWNLVPYAVQNTHRRQLWSRSWTQKTNVLLKLKDVKSDFFALCKICTEENYEPEVRHLCEMGQKTNCLVEAERADIWFLVYTVQKKKQRRNYMNQIWTYPQHWVWCPLWPSLSWEVAWLVEAERPDAWFITLCKFTQKKTMNQVLDVHAPLWHGRGHVWGNRQNVLFKLKVLTLASLHCIIHREGNWTEHWDVNGRLRLHDIHSGVWRRLVRVLCALGGDMSTKHLVRAERADAWCFTLSRFLWTLDKRNRTHNTESGRLPLDV